MYRGCSEKGGQRRTANEQSENRPTVLTRGGDSSKSMAGRGRVGFGAGWCEGALLFTLRRSARRMMKLFLPQTQLLADSLPSMQYLHPLASTIPQAAQTWGFSNEKTPLESLEIAGIAGIAWACKYGCERPCFQRPDSKRKCERIGGEGGREGREGRRGALLERRKTLLRTCDI